MRRTLVILNYQREIPPFLQNLISCADDVFDRVLYFTPELRKDNRDACGSKKLQVIQCERSKWRKSLLAAPLYCFSAPVRRQLRVAAKMRQPLRKVLRQILVQEVCSDTLVRGVRERIESGEIVPEQTVILAAWFASEAYAAAKLKTQYPAFQTASFAHAFEISAERNPLVAFDLNEWKHALCDQVIFISDKMREAYFAAVDPLCENLPKARTCVRYLGSRKLFPEAVCARGTQAVCLLSCSGAVPVKRIERIIEALKDWDAETELRWIHIGGGPLLEQLQKQADAALAGKENVSFRFLGALSNEAVQQYYCTQPVDLFVNVSRHEGLPVSIMECMSYGVPAIATDVGGTSEIVTEQTGFLLRQDFTAAELLSRVKAYLALPQEEKEAMRRAAADLWAAKFCCETNSASLLKWLREGADHA